MTDNSTSPRNKQRTMTAWSAASSSCGTANSAVTGSSNGTNQNSQFSFGNSNTGNNHLDQTGSGPSPSGQNSRNSGGTGSGGPGNNNKPTILMLNNSITKENSEAKKKINKTTTEINSTASSKQPIIPSGFLLKKFLGYDPYSGSLTDHYEL
ncbi:unnamed protein product, partial [Amoebophrya sp. A120]|eukprot:GSA120T00013232001.1